MAKGLKKFDQDRALNSEFPVDGREYIDAAILLHRITAPRLIILFLKVDKLFFNSLKEDRTESYLSGRLLRQQKYYV